MHHIQDIILTVGSLFFSVALIPSLVGKHKPAVSTSILTSIVLVVFAAVYISLSLWFSAVAISINAICWLTLAVQRYTQH
jgi:hypothetical protein